MRKNLYSLLVVVPLLVFVSACTNVGSGSSDTNTTSGPPQPPAGLPAPVQSVISDCGTTISVPGIYSLNSSLTTNSNPEACLTITGTDNVTLNCNGNSVTGVGQYGIGVLNVNNLIIKNCNVATGTGDGFSTLLGLSNVIGATVTGSTFGSSESNFGGVLISDSTNITFGSQLPSAPANPSVTATTNPSISGQILNAPPASNTVYGFINAWNNVNLVIEGNALSAVTSSVPNSTMISTVHGQNTHVVNNTVNGLGSPIPIGEPGAYTFVGADDDILIANETGPGSLVSGNLLVNAFDCGVETVGFMNNITLSDNHIDTVSTGIGGWYQLNVTNARFAYNVMTNIEYRGFRYFRIGGLRPASSGQPPETTINFTQNQFTGNILSQPLLFQGVQLRSVEIDVYSHMDYVPSPVLSGTVPTPEQFITVDNTFTNNTFDRAFGQLVFSSGPPWTYTSNDVIDGGGNICSGSQTSVPSVSPTFGDQAVALSQVNPINCGNGN